MKRSRTKIFTALFFIALTTVGLSSSAASSDRGAEIQKKVQGLQQQMMQVSEIPKIMDKFEPLMKEKKYKEAEEVVDLAIKKLKEFKASP